jgi:molybdenum cofactor sulfurtransferase
MNLLSIGESGHLSRNGGTPIKKLERSMKHSIDVESIPTNLKKSSSEGAVFFFKDTNAEFNVKGNDREHDREQNLWASRLDLPGHSNGDSRRILEPPLIAARPPSGLQFNRKAQMQQELMYSKVESPRYGYVPTPFSGPEPTQSLDRTSSISSWSSLDGNVTDDFLDYNEAEQRFIEANKEYSESLMIEMVRREEYPDLGLQRQTYLDYANFALASKFQVSLS